MPCTWTVAFPQAISWETPPEEFLSLCNRATIIECNEEFLARYRVRSHQEVIGKPFSIFWDPTSVQNKALLRTFWSSFSTETLGDSVFLNNDGERELLHCTLSGRWNATLRYFYSMSGSQREFELSRDVEEDDQEEVERSIPSLVEAFLRQNIPPAEKPPPSGNHPNIYALEEKVRALEKAAAILRRHVLDGNGTKPLLTRVEALEHRVGERKAMFRFWFPVLVSLLTVGLMSLELFFAWTGK